MEINNFCIFRTKSNGCNKLTVKKCTGVACSFAQTKEQLEASCKKSFERLARLGKVYQRYIADKYYGGNMPWLKGDAGNEC